MTCGQYFPYCLLQEQAPLGGQISVFIVFKIFSTVMNGFCYNVLTKVGGYLCDKKLVAFQLESFVIVIVAQILTEIHQTDYQAKALKNQGFCSVLHP